MSVGVVVSLPTVKVFISQALDLELGDLVTISNDYDLLSVLCMSRSYLKCITFNVLFVCFIIIIFAIIITSQFEHSVCEIYKLN